MEIAPDRSMGAVLVRAFLFFSAAFIAVFAAAFFLLGVWRQNAGAPNESVLESAALAAYTLLVTAVPAAFGFAIVTSPWSLFRELRSAAVAWLSAVGGAATSVVQLTGLAGVFFWVPLPGGPIGAAFRLLLPGAAAGALALLAARFLRPAAPTAR